jgi:hypothetical protein
VQAGNRVPDRRGLASLFADRAHAAGSSDARLRLK